MGMHINHVTFDCGDAKALAGFWSTLTGWHLWYDDDPEVVVAPTFPHDVTGLLFIPVPEGKTAKNRVHLDLQPEGMRRDEAVELAMANGATLIGDFRKADGSGWVTLADPEGNEFCIERSKAEVPATPRRFKLGE